jgi:hypothetical protein
MPRGDRTGPEGIGHMTGRGAGYCAGYGMPGFMNPASGSFAGGFGLGRGRGRRNRYYATGLPGWQRGPMGSPDAYPPYAPPVSPDYMPPVPQLTREQEANALREQVEMMQENIEAARERLEKLVKEKED